MSQDEIVRALETPDFYPHRPRTVEHVQTHISHVFLAGPYVYKLKKAVGSTREPAPLHVRPPRTPRRLGGLRGNRGARRDARTRRRTVDLRDRSRRPPGVPGDARSRAGGGHGGRRLPRALPGPGNERLRVL